MNKPRYPIDPEFLPFVLALPEFEFDDVAAARAQLAQMSAMFLGASDEDGVELEDRSIPGPPRAPEVGIRIYRPVAESANRSLPGLLYIHGGGFVLGDLDSEHAGACELCRDLGIVLVSVDYRLAPEHRYPSGLEDCYAALEWTFAHADELGLDPHRIGVMGQSAGGGLSAAIALLARDRKGPSLCFQYLGIPELDDRLETPSMRAFVDTPLWNRPNAIFSWDAYLGEGYRRGSPDVPAYAAPARAADLSGLPPAYVTTMEFDPLRDEGIEYALRLLQAGVRTELHSYPGTFHGSSLVTAAPVSQRERNDMKAAIRDGLGISKET
ncbi:MAG: alpha/beta hydrolase [Myxococcota bacterium]